MFFQSGLFGPRKLFESEPSHCQHPATHGNPWPWWPPYPRYTSLQCFGFLLFVGTVSLWSVATPCNFKNMTNPKYTKNQLIKPLTIEILYSWRGPGFESGAWIRAESVNPIDSIHGMTDRMTCLKLLTTVCQPIPAMAWQAKSLSMGAAGPVRFQRTGMSRLWDVERWFFLKMSTNVGRWNLKQIQVPNVLICIIYI